MKWTVSNDRVKSMASALDSDEKKFLEFDMTSVDWQDYFKNYAGGLKQYFCKEDVRNAEKSMINYRR